MARLVKGNPKSSVALCTLWTPCTIIAKKTGRKHFYVAANMYSAGGINELLRTILAHPQIRTLVITGADLSGSGAVLEKFFAKGVARNKVRGTEIYIEKEIPAAEVERVRKHVNLIDLRGAIIPELKEQLALLSTQKKKAFAKPKTFPESDKVVDTLESERTGFSVRAGTIAQAWLDVLDCAVKFGIAKKSEHGPQYELLNMTAVIDESGDVPKWMSSTADEVQRYLKYFFDTKKHPDMEYDYGERLFSKQKVLGNVSQIKKVVEKLKKKEHTRRAVADVWRIDDLNSENPPCLTEILFSVQEGIVYLTAHFRSHEAYKAWPMNVFALRKLQFQVGVALKKPIGPLTVQSHSLHVYKRDAAKAERALKHKKVRYAVREYDPRGVFTIKVVRGKIHVTHLTMDGQKTGNRFSGSNVEKLLSEIDASNLVSQKDHLGYLGMELQKAKDAITFKKKYVQDSALQ